MLRTQIICILSDEPSLAVWAPDASAASPADAGPDAKSAASRGGR